MAWVAGLVGTSPERIIITNFFAVLIGLASNLWGQTVSWLRNSPSPDGPSNHQNAWLKEFLFKVFPTVAEKVAGLQNAWCCLHVHVHHSSIHLGNYV